MSEQRDVVVVGGGPAGLSGALALAAARRRVLVVDAGEPRNAAAGHVHNYLGREGAPPDQLLADGRREVESYGGELWDGRVVRVERVDDDPVRFLVGLEDGREVHTRRVLVATGLVDELPDVPGLRERWGRDVLHCPYCHGRQVQDRRIGVLATGPAGPHQAQLFRQWSEDVVLLAAGTIELADDEREVLDARGVDVVDEAVAEVLVEDDAIIGVRTVAGEVVGLDAVVVAPFFRAASAIPSSLGVAEVTVELGGHVVGSAVEAEASGATSAPGLWVAGNAADLRAQVVTSAASGMTVGAAVNADLVHEDGELAVAARRERVS